MTYASNAEKLAVASNFLAVISPTALSVRSEGDWEYYSTSTQPFAAVYRRLFTKARVSGYTVVENAAVILSYAEQSSLDGVVSGQNTWFYDEETSYLYVNEFYIDNVDNWLETDFRRRITYDIYVATDAVYWHRTPTDATKSKRYFEPWITQAPSFASDSSDFLQGTFSNSVGGLVVANEEGFFDDIVNVDCFYNARFRFYHLLGDPSVANASLIFSGLIDQVEYKVDSIGLRLIDENIFARLVFNGAFTRHSTEAVFFPSSSEFDGKLVPKLYGFMHVVRCVNISLDKSVTTSGNRLWATHAWADLSSSENNVTTTVLASPSSTATRTYITDATGIQVGDLVRIDTSPDSMYVIVTLVNKTGTNYIEHLSVGITAGSGDFVIRESLDLVYILQNGVVYNAYATRDFVASNDGTYGRITFLSSMEANVGISDLSPDALIFCRVHAETMPSGFEFGADSELTGGMSNPIMILYHLLINSNVPADDTDFTAIYNDNVDVDIGLILPESRSDETIPTIKTAIKDILASMLLLMFIKNNGNYGLRQLKPFDQDTTDHVLYDEDIIVFAETTRHDNSAKTVVAQYGQTDADISYKSPTTRYLTLETTLDTDNNNLFLIDRTRTIKMRFIDEAQTQIWSNRISYIVNTPSTKIECQLYVNKGSLIEVGDVVEVHRLHLPPFAYDGETVHTKKFRVLAVRKTTEIVTLTLDDQKGIEDNASNW